MQSSNNLPKVTWLVMGEVAFKPSGSRTYTFISYTLLPLLQPAFPFWISLGNLLFEHASIIALTPVP